MSYVPPQPLPGLAIKPPAQTPQAGQVIVGYEKFRYPADPCDCNGLNETAFIWMIVLLVLGLIFIFPLFCVCIPLCCDDCRKEYQRPVYGFAGQFTQTAQYAQAGPQYAAPAPQHAQPAPQYAAPAPQYAASVPYPQPSAPTV
eukprot:TRINITY_DN4990_c0_g1_i10.p6 TRINITY_DN4990_c0_g1~~TRINITY_DN4990_c0_g1_i10.p6  ORF type:complete len:165 (-),score=22.56 TRINITY_DN4990_c0_g1_i10:1731-2159(-)